MFYLHDVVALYHTKSDKPVCGFPSAQLLRSYSAPLYYMYPLTQSLCTYIKNSCRWWYLTDILETSSESLWKYKKQRLKLMK